MYSLLHIGIMTGKDGFARELAKVTDYNEIAINGHTDLNGAILGHKKTDIVFIQIQNHGISNHTIRHLRAQGSVVINWSGDVRDSIPSWMHDFGATLTCFSNQQDVDDFQCDSEFLQIGIDPTIYNKDGFKHPSPEIVFFGNSFGNQFPLSGFRRQMVHFMHDTFGQRFGVFGGGWMYPSGNFNNNQPGEAATYRSAKMAINCSHFDRNRYTSDRMFRILGCGVLCLSKWYPGIEMDFEDGVNLIVWRTLDELRDKVNYYSEHTDEAKKIADSGYRLAHSRHTFANMSIDIIKLYEKWR